MAMNKALLYCFGAVFGTVFGAGLVRPALGDVSIEGEIEMIAFDFVAQADPHAFSIGVTTIDFWDFSVLSDGQVQLDTLSWTAFESWIDPVLYLFDDDGTPVSLDGFITSSNTWAGPDLNGSVGTADAFIDIYLAAGDYTAVVGTGPTSLAEVVKDGQSFAGTLVGEFGSEPEYGAYRLDIFGDVAVIPQPSVLAVLGIGGVLGVRRRR